MYRTIEYTYFFIILILLQAFLFCNINLGVYVHPLTYIAFIILLPMELKHIAVLILGLVTGVMIDVLTGGGGIHTISTLLIAFLRPYITSFIIGREEVKEGGIPMPERIGMPKFLRYGTTIVLIHSFVFFTMESLTFKYYYLTLIRIAMSSAVTLVLVYFSRMLLPEAYGKRIK